MLWELFYKLFHFLEMIIKWYYCFYKYFNVYVEIMLTMNKASDQCTYFLITGAIFEQGTDEVQSAFKFAMFNHNQNTTTRKFEFQAFVDVINTADAYKLSRLSKYELCLLVKSTMQRQFLKNLLKLYFDHLSITQ